MAARDRIYLQAANGFRFAGDGQQTAIETLLGGDGQARAVATLFEGLDNDSAATVVEALGIQPTESPMTTSPATRGITGETWFANRIGGSVGTGTKEDPLDGSTLANFDTQVAAAIAADRMICLHEGLFPTLGRYAYLLPHDVAGGIVGSGMGRSIIQVSSTLQEIADTWTFQALLNDDAAVASYLLLEGFTLDLNMQSWAETPHRAAGGVAPGGNYNTVRNVEVINQYGDLALAESFAFLVGSPEAATVETSGSLTENCIVRLPRGDYCNAFTMIGDQTLTYAHRGGIIRNCKAYMAANDTNHMVGYNLHVGTVEGCLAVDCTKGLYSEGCWDIYSLNNEFRRCTIGGIYTAAGNGRDIENLTVEGGIIEMKPQGVFSAGTAPVYCGEGTNSSRNITIRGVRMLSHPDSAYVSRHLVIGAVLYGNEISIQDCQIDVGFSFTPVIPALAKVSGNVSLTGGTILGLADRPVLVPETLQGLVEWFEARFITGVVDGAECELWPNRVNGALNAAGTTGPIYRAGGGPSGTPCLEFTGTQSLTVAYTLAQPYTLMVVYLVDPANAGRTIGSTVAANALFGGFIDTVPRWAAAGGVGVGPGSGVNNQWYGLISTWTTNPGVYLFDLASNELGYSGPSTSWGASHYIGSREATDSFFTGKVAAFFVFNRVLAADEIILMSEYIKAHYPGAK